MFRKRYLTGGQAKLDANKDGKISGDDFKILRNKNKNKNKMTSDQKEKAMDTLKKYKGKPINPILKKTTGATKAKPLNRTNKFFGGAVRLGSAGLKYLKNNPDKVKKIMDSDLPKKTKDLLSKLKKTSSKNKKD